MEDEKVIGLIETIIKKLLFLLRFSLSKYRARIKYRIPMLSLVLSFVRRERSSLSFLLSVIPQSHRPSLQSSEVTGSRKQPNHSTSFFGYHP